MRHKWANKTISKSRDNSSVACVKCGCIKQYIGGEPTYFIDDTIHHSAKSCDERLVAAKQIITPTIIGASTIDYLKNCIYWINEYFEGRVTKKRFLNTLECTYHNCLMLIQELNSDMQSNGSSPMSAMPKEQNDDKQINNQP